MKTDLMIRVRSVSYTHLDVYKRQYRFYVSDLADEFKAFANSILPYDVEMTKKIDIEKYLSLIHISDGESWCVKGDDEWKWSYSVRNL